MARKLKMLMVDSLNAFMNVTEVDDFVEMPSEVQALYFHLLVGADYNGHNDRQLLAMFKANADKEAFDLLIDKGFISIVSGKVVIKHWQDVFGIFDEDDDEDPCDALGGV